MSFIARAGVGFQKGWAGRVRLLRTATQPLARLLPRPAGHQALRLPPGAAHTLTLALSTADGPHRAEESGLLQQLLLLILAVPADSRAAAWLGGVGRSIAVAEAVEQGAVAATDLGSGAAGGSDPHSPQQQQQQQQEAGRPAAFRTSPAYRVFVVGRQATVALVRRVGELQSLLSVEAKPFVAEALRRVFDAPPWAFLSQLPGEAQW